MTDVNPLASFLGAETHEYAQPKIDTDADKKAAEMAARVLSGQPLAKDNEDDDDDGEKQPEVKMSGPTRSAGQNLLDFLCGVYQVPYSELPKLQPMSKVGIPGHGRMRERTITIPMTFEGSAVSFDNDIANGQQIMMKIGEAIDAHENSANIRRLLPRENKNLNRTQGLTEKDFSPLTALVSRVYLTETYNGMPQGVGIETNALPAAYAETAKRQKEDLAAELRVKPDNPDIVAHIPSNADQLPDSHHIHILKEIPNSFHGQEVIKTFGAITARHLPKGVIGLSPEQAKNLGLAKPRGDHDALPPPEEGRPQAYNSWCIIPIDHVLGYMTNIAPGELKRMTYETYQLALPNKTPLPFVLADLWTVMKYSKATTETLMAVDKDRTSIPDIYIKLVPLRGKSWIASCPPGRHEERGKVSFNLVVKYFMTDPGFRENGKIVATLTDNFRKMSREMRMQASKDVLREQRRREEENQRARAATRMDAEEQEAEKTGLAEMETD